MRTTTLRCFQWRKHAGSDIGERLKKFRKHFENGRKLQNIDRKGQIKVLIVTIPTCGVSAPLTSKTSGQMDGSLRTEGWADKYTIANATDHMLHRPYKG